MTARQPSELLYDSEATLRLVDSAMQEMGVLGFEHAAVPAQILRADLTTVRAGEELASLLVHGHAETAGVLDVVRRCRYRLERSPTDQSQSTHDKLLEVADANEGAATVILDQRQQLSYALTVMTELEARLANLARILDPTALGPVAIERPPAPLSRERS